MQRTRKKQEQTFQDVISVNRFLGVNSTLDAIKINPGESASLKNFDLYAGKEGDYIEARKGSRYLRAAAGSSKYGSTAIANRITWDIGSEEYLITQVGTGMRAQALITTANPVDIALATGGAFALGSTAQAELFISGDKLYVMHPSGNYVIRWTGSAFVAYPMGLAFPHILAVTSANAGAITGSYTLGIEKVYQASGVDLMASTPNRKLASTRILATTGTISAKKIKATLQATELDNDTLWTHLRFWRSKSKNTDNTDPLNPLDAQGNDDELYEEALITKAEIGAGSLTSIATGATLPPGNAGTQAGKPGGVYTIEVNNADSVFFNLIGIDRIELLPIPAATTGCFCANRIFFSGVQDAALDDASKSNIWYSNYAGTKYAFQYNPLNFVDAGRDGQNMIKLITFEKDVIGLKESSTGRIPSGNVDIPYQTLDDRIGIKNKSFATFVPTVGLVAITSDFGDFRIFDYSLRWTSTLNGMDISTPVRSSTSSYASSAGNTVTFAYINGKLILSSMSSSAMLVLHAKEGRGWTTYEYRNADTARVFSFAGGTRVAMVSVSAHLVEMEITDLTTDIDTSTDLADTIPVRFATRAFRRNEGQDILEHEYLSINGRFAAGSIAVLPSVNSVAWPDPAGSTTYNLTPNASVAGAYVSTNVANREYRLYVKPETVGTLKWCPMAGNFLAYSLTAVAPCQIRSYALHCIVDENGMGWGAFDPLGLFPTTNTDPSWAQ
jgi:hypothetical protein